MNSIVPNNINPMMPLMANGTPNNMANNLASIHMSNNLNSGTVPNMINMISAYDCVLVSQ